MELVTPTDCVVCGDPVLDGFDVHTGCMNAPSTTQAPQDRPCECSCRCAKPRDPKSSIVSGQSRQCWDCRKGLHQDVASQQAFGF